MKHQQKQDKGQPINERIRFDQLQVISNTGENLGILPKRQALSMAQEVGLDLVLLSEQGGEGHPVAKIMDFGKALYAKKKKMAEAKKHQKSIQIKEIKLRPKIGDHDLQTKMKKAFEFLKEGKHLKVTIAFRGREMATKYERGSEMFNRIETIFKEYGFEDLQQEKDSKAGPFWSRIYFVKPSKK